METAYGNDGKVTTVFCGDEVVEEFESCGCLHNDIGMCQGCPECRIRPEAEFWNDYDQEDEAYAENLAKFSEAYGIEWSSLGKWGRMFYRMRSCSEHGFCVDAAYREADCCDEGCYYGVKPGCGHLRHIPSMLGETAVAKALRSVYASTKRKLA